MYVCACCYRFLIAVIRLLLFLLLVFLWSRTTWVHRYCIIHIRISLNNKHYYIIIGRWGGRKKRDFLYEFLLHLVPLIGNLYSISQISHEQYHRHHRLVANMQSEKCHRTLHCISFSLLYLFRLFLDSQQIPVIVSSFSILVS